MYLFFVVDDFDMHYWNGARECFYRNVQSLKTSLVGYAFFALNFTPSYFTFLAILFSLKCFKGSVGYCHWILCGGFSLRNFCPMTIAQLFMAIPTAFKGVHFGPSVPAENLGTYIRWSWWDPLRLLKTLASTIVAPLHASLIYHARLSLFRMTEVMLF